MRRQRALWRSFCHMMAAFHRHQKIFLHSHVASIECGFVSLYILWSLALLNCTSCVTTPDYAGINTHTHKHMYIRTYLHNTYTHIHTPTICVCARTCKHTCIHAQTHTHKQTTNVRFPKNGNHMRKITKEKNFFFTQSLPLKSYKSLRAALNLNGFPFACSLLNYSKFQIQMNCASKKNEAEHIVCQDGFLSCWNNGRHCQHSQEGWQ